jgi:hypothetical protein
MHEPPFLPCRFINLYCLQNLVLSILYLSTRIIRTKERTNYGRDDNATNIMECTKFG